MGKVTTIKFKRDFSPRKRGEIAELETKLADYYLSIGVAELPCNGCDDKKPCEDCNKEAINIDDIRMSDDAEEKKQTKKQKQK
jgi:hypothetical protein